MNVFHLLIRAGALFSARCGAPDRPGGNAPTDAPGMTDGCSVGWRLRAVLDAEPHAVCTHHHRHGGAGAAPPYWGLEVSR